MNCQNPNCYAGNVVKSKKITKKNSRLFHPEICPDCKGKWNNPLDLEKLSKPISNEQLVLGFDTEEVPF